ncbi:MFS family permease [Allocatelliglobosispora scoriae]|uniref:MFS family permease n=1 Tax=Allocatelliglobosispora scoriae TaxID=643052 RepID=A0A841BEJ4_9ACTN|nr:MFS transporter [Allocatelliglobosispora scoriae]MBB5867507.1 MFS family permease [Allocatelliglobosispora scoriae]
MTETIRPPRPANDGACADARRVVLARGLRTVGYGATSVLLAGMLLEDGCAPAQIGLLIAVAAAGSVVASMLMGAFADRFGRRRALLASAALMATAGAMFAACESYPLLLLAAFVGTVSPSTNDNTPFSGVEQAILAQTTPDPQHTRVFTAYNFIALLAGALGGLIAAALGRQGFVSAGDLAFCLYTVLAAGTFAVCWRLSPDIEPPPAAPLEVRVANPLPARVRWLAGLFAVDAFAGGLAVQTMLAWWLHHRFDATPTQLGLLFFGTNLLSAMSLLAAPALAARHGLLQTMLVPHATANVLLLCLPLASGFGLAATLLLARHALSKIDVPARQAFVAAIVAPVQRTAAASLTSVARSVAACASPVACTALLSSPVLAAGAPLVIAGVLSMSYDAGLWAAFRQPATDPSAGQ